MNAGKVLKHWRSKSKASLDGCHGHRADTVFHGYCRWSLGYPRRITSCFLGLLTTRLSLSLQPLQCAPWRPCSRLPGAIWACCLSAALCIESGFLVHRAPALWPSERGSLLGLRVRRAALQDKRVTDVMTPLERVYSLEASVRLNFATMMEIYKSGGLLWSPTE